MNVYLNTCWIHSICCAACCGYVVGIRLVADLLWTCCRILVDLSYNKLYDKSRTNRRSLVEFGPERACNCNCNRIIHATTLDRTNQREGSHMDRRLRPRCCHLASYFKRPKSSPVRPLARSWYYCVHFIAKPKAACALRFSWAATSSNLGLRAIMMSFIKPEVHNVSLRCQRRTEPATGSMRDHFDENPKI